MSPLVLQRLPRGKLPASVAVSVDFVVETVGCLHMSNDAFLCPVSH